MKLIIEKPMIFKVNGTTHIELTKSDCQKIGIAIIQYWQHYGADCNKNIAGNRVFKEMVLDIIPEIKKEFLDYMRANARELTYQKKHVELDERLKVIESIVTKGHIA